MNKKFDSAFSNVLIYVFAIFDERHKGCLKIGKTTVKLSTVEEYSSVLHENASLLNQAAKKRIDTYTKTAGIEYKLLHTELAEKRIVKENKTELHKFSDYDVHSVLKNSGIENVDIQGSKEWFKTDLGTVKNAIKAVKEGRQSLKGGEVSKNRIPIKFRPEQEDAITMTVKRFKKYNKMLWNAKMRFGKTLSTLEVINREQFKKTIILTHRPVVDASWHEDFNKIFWNDNKYLYCKLGTPESQIKKHVQNGDYFVFFASIQDMRGSNIVGGKYHKNSFIFDIEWDLVVIDEAHEGTRTSLGEDVLNQIIKDVQYNTKQIYLSGTPFNLVHDFEDEEVYTWDYIMEQRAKKEWDIKRHLDSNPYEGLPKLSIYTYDIAEAIPGYETIVDKAFNFREFFRVWTGEVENDGRRVADIKNIGKFVHENDVRSFVNLLCNKDDNSNYPFSKEEYQDYFRHTLWMVPGVKEAKALEDLLNNHSIFGYGNFNIINVAGEEPSEIRDPLERVNSAIGDYPEETRTITLSCGRLTTGVTIRPWTAVLMLSGSTNTSAIAYLQTIFRVQTPATINGKIKDKCYVFDFAPDRTLQMVAEAGKLGARPGTTDTASEAKMKEFLNFCPVISIKGSEMQPYDVDTMLRQLKRYYASRVAQNGFDDIKLYNDSLLKLTDFDKKKFEDLKDIIGSTKATQIKKDIVISESGLGPEEQYAAEEALKKQRQKKVLSEEEKEALRKLREAREAKSKAISILRAISIRIPLLVYGAEKEIEENITIDSFAGLIDDESWTEFMPSGITKEKFNEFIEYYDKDIFIEAGNQIRRKVKALDELNPTERVMELATIFGTFKNPDKETVLTPWRVVNMHMGDTLGGYNFYNDDYSEMLEDPRFIDHGEVTDSTVANTSAKILEINSKSGLYPLYITYNIYRTKLNKIQGENRTIELQNKLWNETLQENVFVICKTEMAKLITKRTLLGYQVGKINSRYFEDFINQVKNKIEQLVKKIQRPNYWNFKESQYMEFDAIVGNPPYQLQGGSGGSNDASIYQYFASTAEKIKPNYISLILPARWFSAGRENLLGEFRNKMLNNLSLRKLTAYLNSNMVFPSVEIKGGVCYYLVDNSYSGECEYTLVKEEGKETSFIKLNKFDILIREPFLSKIVEKIISTNNHTYVDSIISSDTPFGIPSNPKTSKNNPVKVSNIRSIKFDIELFHIENLERKIEYVENSIISKNRWAISKHKVYIPGAGGSGVDPYVLGRPEYGPKNSVCSQSYLFAAFDSKEEAINFKKYLKTKFFRNLVSAIKISQSAHNRVYKFVPLQNFTSYSDINWNNEISKIDEQLYKKYNLSKDDILYIESRIKYL